MPDWMSLAILIGAGLVAVSIFTSVLASRLGAPLLLLFLGLGLLVGEDGLGLRFDNAPLAYLVGSVALAVILFDSGFATRIRTLRSVAGPALALATVGVLLTTSNHRGGGAPAVRLRLDPGAVDGRHRQPDRCRGRVLLDAVGGITVRDRVRATLEIESGTNDPMAIFLTATRWRCWPAKVRARAWAGPWQNCSRSSSGSARPSVPSGVWRSSRRSIASSSSPGFTRWWCWAWRCCCRRHQPGRRQRFPCGLSGGAARRQCRAAARGGPAAFPRGHDLAGADRHVPDAGAFGEPVDLHWHPAAGDGAWPGLGLRRPASGGRFVPAAVRLCGQGDRDSSPGWVCGARSRSCWRSCR